MNTFHIVLICSLCFIAGMAFGVVIMCTLSLSGRISEQEEMMLNKQYGDRDGDKNEKFI